MSEHPTSPTPFTPNPMGRQPTHPSTRRVPPRQAKKYVHLEVPTGTLTQPLWHTRHAANTHTFRPSIKVFIGSVSGRWGSIVSGDAVRIAADAAPRRQTRCGRGASTSQHCLAWEPSVARSPKRSEMPLDSQEEERPPMQEPMLQRLRLGEACMRLHVMHCTYGNLIAVRTTRKQWLAETRTPFS